MKRGGTSQLAALGEALPVKALEQLFDDMPDVAFFMKDRHGRYVCVNQSLVERCGLRHKRELLGKGVGEVFARDLAESYAAQDAEVISSGTGIRNRLELHRRAEGRTGWCLTTKLPLRNASGVVTGIIGVSRDLASPSVDRHLPHGVARAMDALTQECSDPLLSPASLAKKSGMSAPRFARLVKRIYHLTVGQLITQARLQLAAQKLASSDCTVAEIAIECGFCDHSAFTRAFRHATGLTPTQFRESQ